MKVYLLTLGEDAPTHTEMDFKTFLTLKQYNMVKYNKVAENASMVVISPVLDEGVE